MFHEQVKYEGGGIELRGQLYHNRGVHSKRPAVIVSHAWRGLDDFARQKAKDLARMGYIAFAADVYGHGASVDSDDEAAKLMMPLFLDRQLLQDRIKAAYHFLARPPLVDPQRIGAIGFCFGGLTVIELLRSGVAVRGVVSFHGVLGNQLGLKIANTVPIAPGIKGSILVLHGNEDPLVSQNDIVNFQQEFTKEKIDWQIIIYGQTSHAFTNPEAGDASSGMLYNELTDRRSWVAMTNFFSEIFSGM
jgi:dienelactone hydrolase